MLIPCDDCASDLNIWRFFRLNRDEKGVSLGSLECNRAKAGREDLALAAEEILRPGFSPARVRDPIVGGGVYKYLHEALFGLVDALQKSETEPDRIGLYCAYGDIFVENTFDPASLSLQPMRFTHEELAGRPLLKTAFDTLFAAAEKDEAGIARAWRRFPAEAREILAPL